MTFRSIPAVVALAACFVSHAQSTQPVKPVDRSGEAALKALFGNWAKAKTIFCCYSFYGQEEMDSVASRDGSGELWLESPMKFRYTYIDYFGDGSDATSDGKQMLIDPLEGDVTLTLPPTKFAAGWGGFTLRQSGGFLPLLAGAATAFDDLVSPKDTLTFQDGVFTFTQKGTRTVMKLTVDGNRPVRLDWTPGDGGNAKSSIVVTGFAEDVKAPSGIFSTDPPAGARVDDQRKKPGGY